MTYTLEQQKANRKKWVKALRSGKYKQAKEVLCAGRGNYCCLGVLGRVAGVKAKDLMGATVLRDFPEVMHFVGLSTDNGGFHLGRALSSENDRGKSFAEIADIIESEPKDLFVESVE